MVMVISHCTDAFVTENTISKSFFVARSIQLSISDIVLKGDVAGTDTIKSILLSLFKNLYLYKKCPPDFMYSRLQIQLMTYWNWVSHNHRDFFTIFFGCCSIVVKLIGHGPRQTCISYQLLQKGDV